MPSNAVARRVTLAFLGVASGCGLPSRSNPHDPANAPSVVLRVIDATAPDGTCGDVALDHPWSEVPLASRGRCLVLDASLTTSPRGTAQDELEFAFAYVGTALEGSFTRAIVGSGAFAFLDAPLRQEEAALDVTVYFRARATDPTLESSPTGEDSAPFVFTNRAPVGLPPVRRALPVHGYAWAWDAPASVPYVTTSFDPDADPTNWCWSFPDGTSSCSTDPASPTFAADIPVTMPGRFAASLTGDDGARTSSTVFAHVLVRESTPWVQYLSGETIRIDAREAFTSDPYAGPVPYDASMKFFLSDPPIAVAGLSSFAVWPSSSPFEPMWTDHAATLGCGAAGATCFNVESSLDGQVLWALLRTGLNDIIVRAFSMGEAAGVVELQQVFEVTIPDLRTHDLASDETHRGWASLGIEEIVGGITGVVQGALLVFSTDAVAEVASLELPRGSSVKAFDNGGSKPIAARPGSDEVWVALTPSQLRPPDAEDRYGIQRYGGMPPVLLGEFPSSSPIVDGIAWATPDHFWTFVAGQGLLLVDAEALTNGHPLEEGVRLTVPDAIRGPIAVDPGLGDCWTRSEDGLLQVGTDGTVVLHPDAFMMTVDPDGFGIFYVDTNGAAVNGGRIQRSAVSPASSQVAGRVDYGNETFLDPATGGLWVQSGTPYFPVPALVQVSETGALLRSVHTLRAPNGAALGLPAAGYARFELEGDGARAWGYSTQRGLERLDLTRSPVTTTPVSPALVPNPLQAAMGFVAAPPTAGGFVWFGGEAALAKRIYTVDEAGTSTERFTLPANEGGIDVPFLIFGDVFPDGSLCLTSGRDTFSGDLIEYHVRRIEPDGTPHDLAFLTPEGSSFYSRAAVEVAGGPGAPVCWVGFKNEFDTYLVNGFDESGSVIHTATIDGGFDLKAVSTDRIWVLSAEYDGQQITYLQQITFTGLDTYDIDESVQGAFVPGAVGYEFAR